MADFLGDSSCKKRCMELLLRQNANSIHDLTLEYITANTAAKSGLFKWAIDVIGSGMGSSYRKEPNGRKKTESFPLVVKDALLHKAFIETTNASVVGTNVERYLD